MDSALTASRWDEEYGKGRYADAPPLPFVETILSALDGHPIARRGRGLYVGCGNGRNYVPLVDAGLDLTGLDISPEAIQRLARRRPAQAESLVCADFRTLAPDRRFAYLIAIQVFQHGGDADAAAYFEKVATLLKAGGLFFLRVNSVATQIYHRHTLVEENDFGGLTVRYEDGPKRGLLVHFYSRPELDERTRGGFVPLLAPREDVTVRPAPQTGSWAQWESVWRRLPG